MHQKDDNPTEAASTLETMQTIINLTRSYRVNAWDRVSIKWKFYRNSTDRTPRRIEYNTESSSIENYPSNYWLFYKISQKNSYLIWMI